MKPKTALLIAALTVVALVVADAFVVYRLDAKPSYVAHSALRAFAQVIAAIAAAVAAARFGWVAEYVGRAWTLLFALYGLLTVSYVLDRAGIETQTASDVLTILANAASVGAFWLFGRALRTAGLQFYGPATVKAGVFLAAVAVACALVVPTVVAELQSNAGGLSRTANLVSAVADMLTFILVAPLLLTLWSFRGGQLSWVYGCLALSTIGWMINQAADDLLPAAAVRDGRMTGLFLACLAVAAAAFSQLAAPRVEDANA